MNMTTDIDGMTAEEWFETCEECHGDVGDHDYGLVLGHWFDE